MYFVKGNKSIFCSFHSERMACFQFQRSSLNAQELLQKSESKILSNYAFLDLMFLFMFNLNTMCQYFKYFKSKNKKQEIQIYQCLQSIDFSASVLQQLIYNNNRLFTRYKDYKLIAMKRQRNLYQQAEFYLPNLSNFNQVFKNPFSSSDAQQSEKNLTESMPEKTVRNKQETNKSCSVLQLPKPPFHQTNSIKYSSIFQIIVGRQNIYPMYLDCNEHSLFICAKDCFVICDIQNLVSSEEQLLNHNKSEKNAQGKAQQQRENKRQQNQWLKVVFPDNQMPTTMKAANRFVYFGYNNGKIAEYDLAKLSFSTYCEQFVAPIMQIEIKKENSEESLDVQLLVMDSAANLKIVKFSHKTLMDRIIKVSVDIFQVKTYRKIKKRQKIKKIFKNFLSKQTGLTNEEEYKIPYHYVKFAIPPKQFQKQFQTTIAYFYPYQPEELTLQKGEQKLEPYQDKKSQQKKGQDSKVRYRLAIASYDEFSRGIVGQQVLLSQIKQMGMLSFGYGGFECGNSTYILLVVSVGIQMYYFRAVDVQGIWEWHLVSEIKISTNSSHKGQPMKQIQALQNKSVHCPLIFGAFISNNLVLYLSKQDLFIGNVNQPLQHLQSFNISKFDYINFFNSQSQFKFKFDPKLNYKGILRSWIDNQNHQKFLLTNQDIQGVNQGQKQKTQSGYYVVLQGKRLLIGKVKSWKQYLNKFIQQGQWIQGMKYALLIYQGKLKQLTSISQKIETRKANMQTFFQKLVLTYLSFNIRKRLSQLQNDSFESARSLKSIEQDRNQIKKQKQYSSILDKQTKIDQQGIQEKQKQVKQPKDKCSQQHEEENSSVSPKTVDKIRHQIQDNAGQFDEKITQIIEIAMNFMIQTESQHYLFTTIYQAIVNFQLQRYFYRSLWKHIESKQQASNIKFMTQQILQETVKHYKKLNNFDSLKLLNRIIMNFDLKIMQRALLLSLCLNQGLYEALIYICTEDKDYVTPVVKLSGLRLQRYHNKENRKQADLLSNVIFFYLNQCLKGRMTQYGNTQQFLFMLQQLLSFLFIPSSLEMLGQIDPRKVMHIMDVLFQPKILQIIMENQGLKIRKRINNVERIFQDNCIQQYQVYQNILRTLIFVFTKLGKSNALSQKQYNNQIHLLVPDQQYLHCSCHKIYQYFLWKFVTYTILKNQLPFKIKYKIICTKFFINHPYIFNESAQTQDQKFDSCSEREQQINAFLMRLMDSTLRSLSELQQRLQQQQIRRQQTQQLQKQTGTKLAEDGLNDLDQNKGNQKTQQSLSTAQVSQGQIKSNKIEQETLDLKSLMLEMVANIESSQYRSFLMQSLCYLYHQLQQPQKVLVTYLQMRSRNQREKVFSYLKSNLLDVHHIQKRMNKESRLFLLSRQIIKNLDNLLFLNQQATVQLLIKVASLGFNDSEQIIKKLVSYPELQLQFIERVLEFTEISSIQKKQQSVGNVNYSKQIHSLVVCHLQIVVQNKIEKLQHYIQKMNYPLQQAFKVCEETRNKKGMASILIKSGRNSEGINMLSQIFLENCDKVFKKLAKKGAKVEQQSAQKQELFIVLQSVLINCSKQHKNDSIRGQQIWNTIADRIFRHLRVQNMQNVNIPKPIRQILHQIVEKTINQMFLSVSPKFFVTKFINLNSSSSKNQNSSGLPTSIIMQGFKLIWMKLAFQERVQDLANQLAEKAQLSTYQSIIRQNAKGWLCGIYCGGTQQEYLTKKMLKNIIKEEESKNQQSNQIQTIQQMLKSEQNSQLKQILYKKFGCHRCLVGQNVRFRGQYLTFSQCHHTYHIQCSTLSRCQNCQDDLTEKIQKEGLKLKKKLESQMVNNSNLNQSQMNGGIVVENLTSFGASMNLERSPAKRYNLNDEGGANEDIQIIVPQRIKVVNKLKEVDQSKKAWIKLMREFDEKKEDGFQALKQWQYSNLLKDCIKKGK